MKQAFFIIFLSIVAGLGAGAQENSGRTYVGLGLGASRYGGDIKNTQYHFAIGASVTEHITRQFLIRGRLGYTKIGATDKDRLPQDGTVDRYYHPFPFSSNLFELSVLPEWDFLDLDHWTDPMVTPYVFGGIGAAFFNPKHKPGQPAPTDSKSAITFPVGLGFKYSATDQIRIFIEGSKSFTVSDNLDGYHWPYTNHKDYFYQINFGVLFRLSPSDWRIGGMY